jgi:hypothetical protein
MFLYFIVHRVRRQIDFTRPYNRSVFHMDLSEYYWIVQLGKDAGLVASDKSGEINFTNRTIHELDSEAIAR